MWNHREDHRDFAKRRGQKPEKSPQAAKRLVATKFKSASGFSNNLRYYQRDYRPGAVKKDR